MDGERRARCARFARSSCRTCAVGWHAVALAREIVLGLERAGLDEQPVALPRNQRRGTRVIDDGSHAANASAIGKHFYGSRIGLGFQFPNRKGILVALKFTEGNDSQIRELIQVAEAEIDRAEAFVVGNEQSLWLEPTGEMNKINNAKNNRQNDENPALFIHKQMNGAAASAVEPSIQTRQRVEML